MNGAWCLSSVRAHTRAWRRAGVTDAHPHRFRDTFCVDMLTRASTLIVWPHSLELPSTYSIVVKAWKRCHVRTPIHGNEKNESNEELTVGLSQISQFLKNAGDKPVTRDPRKPAGITELAGEPVSRILFAARHVIPICIETSKRATR